MQKTRLKYNYRRNNTLEPLYLAEGVGNQSNDFYHDLGGRQINLIH